MLENRHKQLSETELKDPLELHPIHKLYMILYVKNCLHQLDPRTLLFLAVSTNEGLCL